MRDLIAWTMLAAAPVAAGSLGDSIEAVLAAPAAQRGVWGIHVVDLSSGEVVYQRNAQVPMTPASVTKLFSTSLALLRLGPSHRLRTEVLASSPVGPGGVLNGDLTLVGGGDPSLSARAVPYRKGPVEGDPLGPLRELARQVAATGLRRVEGDLIADDSMIPWVPYPEGWAAGDAVWEYGSPVSAFVLNDNAFQLTLKAPKEPGEPAAVTLSPAIEYFTIDNRIRVAAGAKREIRINRQAGSRVLQISGSLPPGAAASSLLAVDDPALFAGVVLRRLLAEEGVTVNGRVAVRHRPEGQPYRPAQGVSLAVRESPPLAELLTVVNKISQNLHAELMLRLAASKSRGDATTDLGLDELDVLLKEAGAAKQSYDLSDGSGLSRRGLVAPETVTALLAFLHRSAVRDEFYRTLPVAGEDGTLERRFRGLGDVSSLHAKTGSLSHVNGLSGYIGEDPDRRYAFSILVNHTTATSFEIRGLIDKIGKALVTERAK